MTRPPSAAPGIRDVARAAGVSVATASRVMAKAEYPVAKATRERVLAAARELDFRPNALARGLARARTDNIGVVVPVIVNPYYASMVEAIDRAARERNLTMLLGLTGGDEQRREAVVDDLLGRRVDGLIICAGAEDHVRGRTPKSMGVPVVLIGQQVNLGFPIIKTDNRRAGSEATEYLWRFGHRNFAYLTSHKSWHDFHDRGLGMLSFLKDQQEAHDAQVIEGLLGEADTYEWARKATTEGLSATALLASTDRHALGALAALADAGRKVPQDVSVMGFDDYVTSEFIRPALTTMQMPTAEMGRLAVNALHDRIQGKPVSMRTVVQATLIERVSTASGQGRRSVWARSAH